MEKNIRFLNVVVMHVENYQILVIRLNVLDVRKLTVGCVEKFLILIMSVTHIFVRHLIIMNFELR